MYKGRADSGKLEFGDRATSISQEIVPLREQIASRKIPDPPCHVTCWRKKLAVPKLYYINLEGVTGARHIFCKSMKKLEATSSTLVSFQVELNI